MARRLGRLAGWIAGTVVLTGGLWLHLHRKGEDRDGAPLPTAKDASLTAVFEVSDLAAGACFERGLASEETHHYRLVLEAGEFLHLSVEQRGVDLVVDVHDPLARRVLQVDSPTGDTGTEDAFLVAAISGEHLLALRAWPGGDSEGTYQARVVALGPARDEDRRRATAARAFSDARLLKRDGAREAAAELYSVAAAGFETLGDAKRQARALFDLGQLRAASARRRRDAVEVLQRTLAIYRRLGDGEQQALVLDELGGTWRRLGENERARLAYEEGRELWRRLGRLDGEATIWNNLGLVARRQGRFREALTLYAEALDAWRDLGDDAHQATTLSNMGFLESLLGEPRLALDHHRQALELIDRRHSPPQAATTLTYLGDALLELGETDAALARYREALELRRQLGDGHGEAVTRNSLGRVHERRGEPRRALDAYRKALALFHESQSKTDQATVLNNLGVLYEKLGEDVLARESYKEALASAREVGYPNSELVACFGLARGARRDGDLEAATRHAEDAAAVFETLRAETDRRDLSSSFDADRRGLFSFLVAVYAERHRRDPAAGYDERAFQVSEQASARTLLESLREARAPVEGTSAADELRRLEALRREINELHRRRLDLVRDAAPGPEVEELDRDLRALFVQREEGLARVRADGADRGSVVRPPILSLDAVRRRVLDAETALLAIHLGTDRSYLWAVTSEGSTLRELPGREKIEDVARRLHRSLAESHLPTGEISLGREAEKLAGMLLGGRQRPLGARGGDLRGALGRRRLLIVAPGALQYVPFAVLPDPSTGEILGANHEVVNAPSVSVLAVLRERARRRPSPAGVAAVWADPVFEADDERLAGAGQTPQEAPALGRLVHSRREAEALRELAGGGRVFSRLGFDAAVSSVRDGALRDFRIVHFATHGLLAAEHPELSALLLSRFDRAGRPVDGYLRVYEVFHLDLAADLVTLSACRTALGRDAKNAGLVDAFLYAGASQVLVSLWNVNDRATAQLMERFYRAFLRGGLPASQALREAQAALRSDERWRAPYYWAGFVLHGDWTAGGPSASEKKFSAD